MTPLTVIVGVSALSLGARKSSEREGSLAQAGVAMMMLEPGMLLVLVPDALNRIGVAFALVGVALPGWRSA